jgi:hypothetical protein
MSELSRRSLLRGLAAAVAAAGSFDPLAAQEVHRMAAQQSPGKDKPYNPKALGTHEYATLDCLTELIIPAEANAPGARDAGAAAWIDMLANENAQLQTIYTGGLAWLDYEMQRRHSTNFVAAAPAQQRELLDQLAYKNNHQPELAAGARFFEWARRMTVDAFYTSKVGIAALGYQGNQVLLKFTVPAEAIDYMNKRSPV